MRRYWISRALTLLVATGMVACGRSFDTPDLPPLERPLPAQQERAVRLLVAGDLYLSELKITPNGVKGFPALDGLRDGLPAGDIFFANLEAPITDHDVPISEDKTSLHRSPRGAAPLLRQFGVGVVSLANNHILDYGVQGLRDTQAALDAVGIRHFGAGVDIEEAAGGAIMEVAGLRVGFLGFMQRYPAYQFEYPFYANARSPGVPMAHRDFMAPAIARMRKEVDTLVVSLHFGREYHDVNSKQVRMARLAVSLGADVVVGHHTHNLQGLEVYRGVPILYSLGNFAFPGPGRFNTMDDRLWALGWLGNLCLVDGRVVQLDLHPLRGNHPTDGAAPSFASPAILPDLQQLVTRRFTVPLQVAETSLRWTTTGSESCP